ncbi:MAG: hypothetical protein MK212_06490 [Saprospiraceae bacterium]|nr:hypothetical protein [Saprospiraceae bacterium]
MNYSIIIILSLYLSSSLCGQIKEQTFTIYPYKTYVLTGAISDVKTNDIFWANNKFWFFGKAKDYKSKYPYPYPWFATTPSMSKKRKERNASFKYRFKFKKYKKVRNKEFDNTKVLGLKNLCTGGDLLITVPKTDLDDVEEDVGTIAIDKDKGNKHFGTFQVNDDRLIHVHYNDSYQRVFFQMVDGNGFLADTATKRKYGGIYFNDQKDSYLVINPSKDKTGKHYFLSHKTSGDKVIHQLYSLEFNSDSLTGTNYKMQHYNLWKNCSSEHRVLLESALKNFDNIYDHSLSFDKNGYLVWQFNRLSSDNTMETYYVKYSTSGGVVDCKKIPTTTKFNPVIKPRTNDIGHDILATIYFDQKEHFISNSCKTFTFKADLVLKSTGQLARRLKFEYPLEYMKNDFDTGEANDPIELRDFGVVMTGPRTLAVVLVIEAVNGYTRGTNFVIQRIDF